MSTSVQGLFDDYIAELQITSWHPQRGDANVRGRAPEFASPLKQLKQFNYLRKKKQKKNVHVKIAFVAFVVIVLKTKPCDLRGWI